MKIHCFAAIVAATLPFGVSADEPLPVPHLGEVTVTGSRLERVLAEIPSSISIVTTEEIARQVTISTDAFDLLEVLVPGFNAQPNYAGSCLTTLRGRQVALLVNGVPMMQNLRQSSCNDLRTVSSFAIERIEVNRGATAVFGYGAPGGVVNLITRRAGEDETAVDLLARIGTNPGNDGSSEFDYYAAIGQRFARTDYYLGVTLNNGGYAHDATGTVLPTSDDDAVTLTGSWGLETGDFGDLLVTFNHWDETPGTAYQLDGTQVANGAFTDTLFAPRHPDADDASRRNTVINTTWTTANFEAAVYWQDAAESNRLAEYFEGEIFPFADVLQNERFGVRTTFSSAFADGTLLTYGADYLDNRFYRPIIDPDANDAVIGFVSPEISLTSAAAFLQAERPVGAWLFTGGIRHERFDGEIGDADFDPAIGGTPPGSIPDFSLTLFHAGAIYALSDDAQLFFGFNQGAEVSEFGRAARGAEDPSLVNLSPAKSTQFEAGLRGQRAAWAYTLSAFRSTSDYASLLQPDATCAGMPFCPLVPLRQPERYWGVEATVDYTVNDDLSTGALFTWQRGEFEDPATGITYPYGAHRLSPPRLTAYVDFSPVPQWDNRLQLTHYAAFDPYTAAETAVIGYGNTDSATVVDLSSSYPLPVGRVTLGVGNLFDEAYVSPTLQGNNASFYWFRAEGRRVSVTWSARF